MPTIPDNSVDMVLADLPYGTTKLKWDSLIPLEPLWREISRVTKDDSALVFTASQPFTSTLVLSNPRMFRYEWIWVRNGKASFLTSNYRPMKSHENVIVFSKLPATYTKSGRSMKYNPIKKEREKPLYYEKITSLTDLSDYGYNKHTPAKREYTDKHPTSVLIPPNSYKDRVIVSQKPVALFEYLIRTYTNEGDTVLDPTCGSGTTAVACHKSNRHYICIEKEQEYCEIAEKRLNEML